MPIHDWTTVSAGTFHDFHTAWITHIKETLNGGLLPEGFYAQAEQHAGRVIADVLTLQIDEPDHSGTSKPTTALSAPPSVSRKVTASPNAAYRAARRTLAIRHSSGHRLVALIEILSSANKDRASSIEDFVTKALSALANECHLLIVDLYPPGPFDPQGIHGCIWAHFDPEDYRLPDQKSLTLAAYVASNLPEAYLEHVTVGDELPVMPLFLDRHSYINVPLATTYKLAFRGVPSVWREVLETRHQEFNGS
jgi:hypothetical protein